MLPVIGHDVAADLKQEHDDFVADIARLTAAEVAPPKKPDYPFCKRPTS